MSTSDRRYHENGSIRIVPALSEKTSQTASLDRTIFNPPAEIVSALNLNSGARLREMAPRDLHNGIICGEVSMNENSDVFHRFVYNGSAGTGAIDDGTALFDKFSKKICLLH